MYKMQDVLGNSDNVVESDSSACAQAFACCVYSVRMYQFAENCMSYVLIESTND